VYVKRVAHSLTMDEAAQNVLDKIQAAVAADHVEMTSHFEQQLGIRGMLWADLLTVIDQPSRMEDQGLDLHGWPKWRVWGTAADDSPAAVVVALRDDGHVRFITIHWED
jgi:hypothetical protein